MCNRSHPNLMYTGKFSAEPKFDAVAEAPKAAAQQLMAEVQKYEGDPSEMERLKQVQPEP